MKPKEILVTGSIVTGLALAVAGAVRGTPANAASLSTTASPAASATPRSTAGEVVAIQAGTILPVAGDPIRGGGTLVVDGERIIAVGKDVVIPPGARVVDYGPDAVIVPGLVAADSTYGLPRPSERTADPTLRAVDAFDPYSNFVFALQEGVTSAYLPPARGRLIAGVGAVVKLGGRDNARRVLSEASSIHGAVSSEARNTPGFWRPPLPATIDVGLGMEQPQLPRSLMGAVVALEELVAIARGGEDRGEYGPEAGPALRELMELRMPWRMGATSSEEILALLAFFSAQKLPLVVDGAQGAGAIAEQIQKAGASVIVDAPFTPNLPGRALGKERDAQWPEYDTASKLAAVGVRFALSPGNNVAVTELRFAAGLLSRGGLDRETALRAITLSAAQILGVGERVGSLEVGKDADFVVFNGHPLDLTSAVISTWVEGEIAYKAFETSAVVLEVEELHLGTGEVLTPGQVLLLDGKIAEVGRKVGHPGGAATVRGKAAMPGMIDALGHLGLEGSTRVPQTRFELKRLVEPGDRTDKRVARSGVTTVILSPRGASRSGAPMLAYKPAGEEPQAMVVADPVALRFNWTERNRTQSGQALRETLTKAVDYDKKWQEYEKKKAAWTPPKEEPAGAPKEEEKKDGEAKKDGDAEKPSDAKPDSDKKDDDKKDEEKSSKKKKGEDKLKPVTGEWITEITLPPHPATRLRLYVKEEADGSIHGSLRCDALSEGLVEVSGKRVVKHVTLSGEGTKGLVALDAEQVDAKMKGKLKLAENSIDIELPQTSTEYEVAARPEKRKPKEEPKKEVKGEPKAPGIDPELEPFRRAMRGAGGIVVQVEREDEIVACVDAFAQAGIKPILYGATDAWKVLGQIRGRVAGILLTQRVTEIDPKLGAKKRNRYQELVSSGIPIAFHSAAEEGAADLPVMGVYAVSQGMSPEAVLRALTGDAARMFGIDARVGTLAPGMDADIVLLDGSPLEPASSVLRVWVQGHEVR